MSDEVAKLKSDLHVLNCHIQSARNDEVRHGLQRGRLEAERAQLLVRLIEAVTAPLAPAVPAIAAGMAASPVVPEPAAARKGHLSAKPRPPMSTMIAQALSDGKARRPKDIAKIVRKAHGDSIRPGAIAPVAWKMHVDGKLAKSGHRYRLPVTGLNGHASPKV
jgi:hypothetical protein